MRQMVLAAFHSLAISIILSFERLKIRFDTRIQFMANKKTKADRNRRIAIKNARSRVIDNCWRDVADDTSKPIKILERAVFVLRHFRCMPPAGSVEDILNKAERVSRQNGYNAASLRIEKKKRAPVHTKKAIKSGSRKAKSNAFYASWEWKQVRYESLQMHGRQCMCCGWTPEQGSKGYLCVDHIKPRSKFPELALDVSNTQVLCNSCNMGKSNVHQDDFRSEWHGDDEEDTDPLTAQFRATIQ